VTDTLIPENWAEVCRAKVEEAQRSFAAQLVTGCVALALPEARVMKDCTFVLTFRGGTVEAGTMPQCEAVTTMTGEPPIARFDLNPRNARP
jgi:hypothetical protein